MTRPRGPAALLESGSMLPQTRAGGEGRILVVDDEPVVLDVLRNLLVKAGFDVDAATDAATARVLLETGAGWDAVLLDVMLPDADGLQVLRWIRERQPDLAVVMITAFGTVENAVAAMKLGAFHYLTKPFKNDEVRALVGQAVQTTRLRLENKDLRRALEERYRFERLVGKSRAMQEVYRFVVQVASSRATESGATPARSNASASALTSVEGSLDERLTSSATLYVSARRTSSPSAPALPRNPPAVVPSDRLTASVNWSCGGSKVMKALRR